MSYQFEDFVTELMREFQDLENASFAGLSVDMSVVEKLQISNGEFRKLCKQRGLPTYKPRGTDAIIVYRTVEQKT